MKASVQPGPEADACNPVLECLPLLCWRPQAKPKPLGGRLKAFFPFHSLHRGRRASAGAVAAVQRVDSAVRLNVHFHIIQIDVGGERAGQPTLRLVHGDGSQSGTDAPLDDEPVAEVRGINLYGEQWIDGRDRRQLKRLARYITRPPVAQERLSLRPDGKLLPEFTSAFGASARRGSPSYLSGLRPACWTPSTPVQESPEGRHSRSGGVEFARATMGSG